MGPNGEDRPKARTVVCAQPTPEATATHPSPVDGRSPRCCSPSSAEAIRLTGPHAGLLPPSIWLTNCGRGGFGFGAELDHVLAGSRRVQGGGEVVPFYGAHRAGIATPSQEYLYFAERSGGWLRDVLELWTAAAARLTASEPYQSLPGEPGQPPLETGEAVGLSPSRLHVLAGLASSAATLRWTQQGFGRTSSTSREQSTPRSLIGFKDGTDNIRAEDAEAMNDFVWTDPSDGAPWMAGGTYLITRRIKILPDVWDHTSLDGQQRVIGRASSAELRSEAKASTTRSTFKRTAPAANRSSQPTLTSVSRALKPTADSASSGAATPTAKQSNQGAASSTPDSSSSPSNGAPHANSSPSKDA